LGGLNVPLGSRVYLDTAPVIYSVEKSDEYWPLMLPLWQSLQATRVEVVTSELTLLETLVYPLRISDKPLKIAYETLLTNTEIALRPISRDVIRLAAEHRAAYQLKTPDSIHSATAELFDCSTIITNDARFKRVPGIEVQILSELV
jgi:predicted nucleic acid-binding protein